MQRRYFLQAGGLALVGSACGREREADGFAAIEAELGGRVGVMAVDTADGRELGHRADERFAMCSTFKWLLAACVLARVDRDQASLEETLRYSKADLLEYAPFTREHVAQGALSIDALCAAAVTVSDNTAANLLLERIGGPAKLTAFMRDCGDGSTRLDRNEPALNSNIAGDPRDTTTPRAMAGTMRTLLLGDVLEQASRQRLLQWLGDTTTGLDRLRGGLPSGWVAGDKTGTGANGAANDVAIAWPPGRAPVLIAAYLSGSSAQPDALNEAHRRIAATVARSLR